jgi:hypothetical protein
MEADAWDTDLNGEAQHPMHHRHHHAGEDLQAQNEDLQRDVWAYVGRVNQFSRWSARYASVIEDLRDDLAATRAELTLANQENDYWRRATALEAGLDPDVMPPGDYLAAVRTPQRELYRSVTVNIDNLPCVIGLTKNRPCGIDLLREMRDWQIIVAAIREERAGLAGGS